MESLLPGWRSSSSRSNSPRNTSENYSILGALSPFQSQSDAQPLPLSNLGPPGQPQQDSGISPGMFGTDLALLHGTHQGLVPALLPNGPLAGLLDDDQLSQAAPSTPPLLPLLLDGAAWVEPPPPPAKRL